MPHYFFYSSSSSQKFFELSCIILKIFKYLGDPYSNLLGDDDVNYRIQAELVDFLSSKRIFPYFDKIMCDSENPSCGVAKGTIVERLCEDDLR